MPKKNLMELVGRWAFLIGVVIAALIGLFDLGVSAWVLVVLGIIVGLLNISGKEVSPFLMAATVIVIVSALSKGLLPVILDSVLGAIMILVVPATIIVALKQIFSAAKN